MRPLRSKIMERISGLSAMSRVTVITSSKGSYEVEFTIPDNERVERTPLAYQLRSRLHYLPLVIFVFNNSLPHH